MKALPILLALVSSVTRADVLYTNNIDLAGDDSGKHFHYFDDQLVMQSYHNYLYWHDTDNQGQVYIDDLTTEAYVTNQGKELRISMLYGAENGFSIDYQTKQYASQLSVYDEKGQLLTTHDFTAAPQYQVPSADCEGVADCAYQSTFDDGRLNITYEGIAAYVEFDINNSNEPVSDYEAFLLDNFRYTPAFETPLAGLQGLHMTAPALPVYTDNAYQFDISSLLTTDFLPLFLQIPLAESFDIDIQGPAGVSLALLTPFPYWEGYMLFEDGEGVYGSPTITSESQQTDFAQEEWWDFYADDPAYTGLVSISGITPMTDELNNRPLLLMLGASPPGDYRISVSQHAMISAPSTIWLYLPIICLLIRNRALFFGPVSRCTSGLPV